MPNNTEYTQVCVWGSTIVNKGQEQAFEEFMESEYDIRVQYLENIVSETGSDDAFFTIHSGDISKFAVKRFDMNPPVRWIEDVLANEGANSIYPDRVQQYKTWNASEIEA
jgi:hypothetical protein